MAVQTGNSANYSTDIRKIEPTDPGHADTFNPLFKTLIDNDVHLKETKADKTYVDTEVAKKTTPAEVDARIQALIAAAPSALDTLQELAQALNNDPNFAATITNALSTKVDKVAGKQLSTEDYTTAEKNKLAGISSGANKVETSTTNGNVKIDGVEKTVYTHPATHPATMITEDANHRFVTDAQIAEWNAKQGAIGYTPARVASGTYTGNATANRSISVGFQPVQVIVIGNGRKFIALPGVTTMTPENTALDGKNYVLNDAANFGGINASGFSLGSSASSTANVSGQTYTYVAIG
jgi:hypothetical protein